MFVEANWRELCRPFPFWLDSKSFYDTQSNGCIGSQLVIGWFLCPLELHHHLVLVFFWEFWRQLIPAQGEIELTVRFSWLVDQRNTPWIRTWMEEISISRDPRLAVDWNCKIGWKVSSQDYLSSNNSRIEELESCVSRNDSLTIIFPWYIACKKMPNPSVYVGDSGSIPTRSFVQITWVALFRSLVSFTFGFFVSYSTNCFFVS